VRGPTLLEDFVLREKIFHFDHERIPERIVHARGSAAHGYFELYKSLANVTKADLFQRAGEKTPVFARFSTVAGGAGSVDTPRDVRGFAVKFYTQKGNWDLVGNNIPVFFIQDAIKFPDLVHAVKMEADRAYPQAGSAHDTFWDWASLMPETHAYADVGDVRPRNPAFPAHHRRFRHPHLQAGQCQGQGYILQIPLETEARHAVDAVGRGAQTPSRG
jgi:catalase